MAWGEERQDDDESDTSVEAQLTLSPDEVLTNSLQATLSYIRRHLQLAVDDRLLLSILLVVYAGHHNLVLRLLPSSFASVTERAEFEQRLASQVAYLCTAVFGYVTHQLPCSPNQSSSDFLRDMFLRPEDEQHREEERAQARAGRREERVQQSRSNSVPLTASIASKGKSPSPNRQSRPPIFSPQPGSFEESSAGEDMYPSRPVSARQPSPERRRIANRKLAAGRRDSAPLGTASPGPSLVHKAPTVGGKAFDKAQKSALAAVERESARLASAKPSSPRSTSPPPFAPVTASSRPARLRHLSPSPGASVKTSSRPLSPTLLSPTSTAPTSRRHSTDFHRLRSDSHTAVKILPQVLVVSRLEQLRGGAQQTFLEVLRERRFSLSASGSNIMPGSQEVPEEGVDRGWEGVYALPEKFFVVAIVVDTPGEDGAFHDGSWGEVSRYLVDYFSLSQTIIPSTSPSIQTFPFHVPAPPPLPPTSPILPTTSQIHTLATTFTMHSSLRLYLSDLISALRAHPHLEARMLTMRTNRAFELFTRVWAILSRDFVTDKARAMVGPKDALAVFIGIMAHKVRLRDPARDLSLFWGSTLEALKEARKTTSRSVEEVLRAVAAEV